MFIPIWPVFSTFLVFTNNLRQLLSNHTLTPEAENMAPNIVGITGGLKTSGDALAQSLGIRPPQVPLDVDNYPVAPPDLELEQVHIYVRHGKSHKRVWTET